MGRGYITPSEFKNLIQYYISCIKEENILSLSFDTSKDKERFYLDILLEDELFQRNKKSINLERSERIQGIIERCRESNKNLYYGYPVFIDHRGNISPIFFSRVTIEDKEGVITLVRVDDKVEFNHYILLVYGFEYEEINLIREEIEHEIDVTANIHRILDMLSYKDEKQLSPDGKKQVDVIYKPIIFLDEKTHITHNLILELQKLRKLTFQQIKASGLRNIITNTIKNNDDLYEGDILEVYPCNHPQEEAIRRALKQSLTVITGPPGTGKSQVVLDIIANAVYQDKTVLFASRNNKAVDVVIERLNKLLPYNLIVRMGAQEYRREARLKMESTIRDITVEKTGIKQIDKEKHSELKDVNQRVKTLYSKIDEMSRINSDIDQYQQIIDKLMEDTPTELYLRLKDRYIDINHKKLERYLEIATKREPDRGLLSRLLRIHHKRRIHRYRNRIYNILPLDIKAYIREKNIEDYTTIAKALITLKDIESIKEKIQREKDKLLSYPSFEEIQREIDKIREQRIILSRDILIQHWLRRIHRDKDRVIKNIREYIESSERLERYIEDQKEWRRAYTIQSKAIKKLFKSFPVWIVTNLSAKNSLPLQNNLFDILIIDEASQCDTPSALPLLYRARQVVIIGDPNQLKHISLIKKPKDKNLARQNNIENIHQVFSYVDNSCYNCMEKIITREQGKPLLLNRHYRCHPDIIEFSNQYFYDNQLEIQTPIDQKISDREANIRWINIEGETIPAKSPYNREEIKKTIDVLKRLQRENEINSSYGVVTLFRAQMEKIREEIEQDDTLRDMDITVGTAHRFQGDERDVIIFSLALSRGVKKTTLRWVHTTRQLLNVAITRAKKQLIIIGDKETCHQAGGLLSGLVRYVNQKEQGIEKRYNSQVKEMLYKLAVEHGFTPRACSIRVYHNGETRYYNLDFVILRNNKRYYIDVEDHGLERDDERRMKHMILRENGWSTRVYDIKDQAGVYRVIEEMRRYC